MPSPPPEDLRGIDSLRSLPHDMNSVTGTSKRDSSISLEDNHPALSKHSYDQETPREPSNSSPRSFNPLKSPLLPLEPHELHAPDCSRDPSPEDGCPLIPSQPSPESTTSYISPLEIYLREEDGLRLYEIATNPARSQNHNTFGDEYPKERAQASNIGGAVASRTSSYWEVIDNHDDDENSPLRVVHLIPEDDQMHPANDEDVRQTTPEVSASQGQANDTNEPSNKAPTLSPGAITPNSNLTGSHEVSSPESRPAQKQRRLNSTEAEVEGIKVSWRSSRANESGNNGPRIQRPTRKRKSVARNDRQQI